MYRQVHHNKQNARRCRGPLTGKGLPENCNMVVPMQKRYFFKGQHQEDCIAQFNNLGPDEKKPNRGQCARVPFRVANAAPEALV